MVPLLTRIICTLTSSFAFAIVFQIRGKALIYAPVGALIAGLTIHFLNGSVDYAMEAFLSATAGVTYAEIMARVQKEPVSAYLTIAILPTVPGRYLYSTMEYFINHDIDMFLQEGVKTFIIAGMIAAAVVVVTTSIQMTRQIKASKRKLKIAKMREL